jgi:hypothetical protein
MSGDHDVGRPPISARWRVAAAVLTTVLAAAACTNRGGIQQPTTSMQTTGVPAATSNVPLLFGLLILVPLQVYLGLRQAGDTSSYADFYAHFWDVRPSLDFPFVITAAPGEGLFETGHMWFLVCLEAFSLVLLPGLSFLLAGPGARLVEGLARLLGHPVPSPVTRPREATGAPHGWGTAKPRCPITTEPPCR